MNKKLILTLCLSLLILTLNSGCKSGDNLTSNNAKSGTPTSPREEKPSEKTMIYELRKQADKLWTFGTTLKQDPQAKLKGKVAIVWRDSHGKSDLAGFTAGSDFDTEMLAKFGLSKADIALTTDEIDSLLRVTCEKGAQVGQYKLEDGIRTLPAFASECVVEPIDYKTGTRFAERKFVNRKVDQNVKVQSDEYDYVAAPLWDEVAAYFKTLRSTK